METVEHQRRWASGASRVATRRLESAKTRTVPPAYPACLSEGVLLPFLAEGPGGWEAGSSAQASPVSRRQAVCLRGGAGALTPSDPRAEDAGYRDGVG